MILALFIVGIGYSTLTQDMFNALLDQIDRPSTTIAAVSKLMIIVTALLLVVAQFDGDRRTD